MLVFLTSPFKSCRRPATPHTPTPNNILHHNYALLFFGEHTNVVYYYWCYRASVMF